LIPESYISDDKERSREESLARLAESTQRFVEITNTWKEMYGAMPAEPQVIIVSFYFRIFIGVQCYLVFTFAFYFLRII
jgi:transcription-repair coupling factor (superfamily II helicase)